LNTLAGPGEHIGLGTETGTEHAEWRLIKGKMKRTLSIKK
jgi:hypothetical protein